MFAFEVHQASNNKPQRDGLGYVILCMRLSFAIFSEELPDRILALSGSSLADVTPADVMPEVVVEES